MCILKMNIEILGERLSRVYQLSSSLKAIYDEDLCTIVSINPEMEKFTGDISKKNIIIYLRTDDIVFIQIDGVPCKLRYLYKFGKYILVEAFLAHTKKWNQSSDLVSLTDVTSDGVWEWFPELNYEYMSERFWNILGYDQKDMDETPQSWMKNLNPDDVKMTKDLYETHVKSRGEVPYICKARYKRIDGIELFILCRGSIVEWLPDGRPWRMLGTHTDITDIVKKDAIDAKTKFIERMSHEIRSPICTIINECELLDDNKNTVVIRDTCDQLISIADNILRIDKSKSNDMELNCTITNISDIVSKTIKRHKIEASKKNIRIRLMTSDIPDLVNMDIVKFNQIMDNIIGNSLKYSDKGLIIIDLDHSIEESKFLIRITDNGIGMDPGFHVKAFEDLIQGDETMVGMGIGLSLARSYARLMDGDVVIEKSSLGEGTTILFTSILETIDENDISDEEDVFKVLMVDDIPTNRLILKRRIEGIKKMGINVTDIMEASNGREAVDVFIKENGDFNLVLMDCHMPIMDGFEATRAIHKCCVDMNIDLVPVVAVTASVSSDINERCNSAGMEYVVTKPYSEKDLVYSIRSCMEK